MVEYATFHTQQLIDKAFPVQYIQSLQEALGLLEVQELARVRDTLRAALDTGHTVFIMGNGGSASTASHFACDLAKSTITPGMQQRFRVVSMVDNISLLTAWSNDTSYEEVFKEQLVNLACPGDVVIAISTSGKSNNVLKAVEFAKSAGMTTIGMTGASGGTLGNLVDFNIAVPSQLPPMVEDLHLMLQHLLCTWLASDLQKGS